MSEVIIQVENLSKRYSLSHQGGGNRGLRHVLNDFLSAPFRKSKDTPRCAKSTEEFWALQDVSFEIKRGEVVGIIGRNGAGKSTLLKILSRITEPTSGTVELSGRVASLLEVGTGFHPELTGRENIYLNGAILGMARSEIKNRFDEIVAFAEVERFLDTPVKHYSSGMYVRLAFAVAAHLEPEILIIDEVLAVGDATFQKKCLGKMENVAKKDGRTVLFVSHNMGAVQRLCTDCKLLDAGRLVLEEKPELVIQKYMGLSQQQFQSGAAMARRIDCRVRFEVLNEQRCPTRIWRRNEKLFIRVQLIARQKIKRPAVDLAFYGEGRTRLFALQSDRLGVSPECLEGDCSLEFSVENPGFILPEIYFDLGVREGDEEYFELICEAGRITPDYNTFPENAATESILFPSADVVWSRELMAQ